MTQPKGTIKGGLPDEIRQAVCKMGQGAATCRYLVCGSDGFECAKHSEFRSTIDARVAAGTFVAQGDGCEGYLHV